MEGHQLERGVGHRGYIGGGGGVLHPQQALPELVGVQGGQGRFRGQGDTRGLLQLLLLRLLLLLLLVVLQVLLLLLVLVLGVRGKERG